MLVTIFHLDEEHRNSGLKWGSWPGKSKFLTLKLGKGFHDTRGMHSCLGFFKNWSYQILAWIWFIFCDRWLVSLFGQQFRGNNFIYRSVLLKTITCPFSAATRVINIMSLILIDIILIYPVAAEPIFFYLLNGILFNFTRHN